MNIIDSKIKVSILFLLNVSMILGQWSPIPGGWTTTEGKTIEVEADSTLHSSNGIARYVIGGEMRFVKTSDSGYESKSYEMITDFNEGFAMAKKDGKWMVIDTLENIQGEVSCHYGYGFSDGLARIQLGNRFGYVNTKGEVAIPVKYYGAHDFSEGLARVYINKKWGFIDENGKLIIKAKYDYVWNFTEGLASVMLVKNEIEKWGFINQQGEEVIELKYGYVFPFSNGMSVVRWGDMFSTDLRIVDKEGVVLYKLPYTDAYSFSEGLACVYQNGYWGFIDTNFELVIQPVHQSPQSFKNGLVYVTVEGKSMYINKSGKAVWE